MSLVSRTLENWRSETDEVKSLSYTRARAKKNSTPFFQMHLSSQNTYHNFTTFTYKYSSCSCVNILWWPWNGKEIKTYVMDFFLTTHLDYFSIFKLQWMQYKRIKWMWQAYYVDTLQLRLTLDKYYQFFKKIIDNNTQILLVSRRYI